MKRIESAHTTAFGLENSSADSNRFYSILLDARAIKVSENMCDIAEKLVLNEKDNARNALEQLGALKKNLQNDKSSTIDLLIHFYQEKIDILRDKEERIKNVSRDSRQMLEEKRRKDEEIASVKQQISDCSRELTELTVKLERLTIKEQELALIELQLKKELDNNENEIINGLYEIILSQPDDAASSQESGLDSALPGESDAEATNPEAKTLPDEQIPPPPLFDRRAPSSDTVVPGTVTGEEDPLKTIALQSPFPRSVVKTTQGRIIGEYYYDNAVEKSGRHYIFNSIFFYRALLVNNKVLKARFNEAVYNETLQIMQDVYKRITSDKRFHFEVSTNEILNEKLLKQLWLDAKARCFDEIERFCNRLIAKIEALNLNYQSMLKEQMERCTNQA